MRLVHWSVVIVGLESELWFLINHYFLRGSSTIYTQSHPRQLPRALSRLLARGLSWAGRKLLFLYCRVWRANWRPERRERMRARVLESWREAAKVYTTTSIQRKKEKKGVNRVKGANENEAKIIQDARATWARKKGERDRERKRPTREAV